MERLARVAHRIVRVNPRASARGFELLARGMAAALPYVDELVAAADLDAVWRRSALLERGRVGRRAVRDDVVRLRAAV